MLRVCIAGEGKNELGSRGLEIPYATSDQPGVVETLLERLWPDRSQWEIAHAIPWKRIRKLRTSNARAAEAQNLLGAAYEARSRGCHVLVFVRDRDRDSSRAEAFSLAQSAGPGVPAVGGLAIEMLEAWILALDGVAGSERLGDPHARLRERLEGETQTDRLAAIVLRADLACIPADAASLLRWIAAVRDHGSGVGLRTA